MSPLSRRLLFKFIANTLRTFTKQELTEEFKEHFGITEVHRSFNGGQKNVFIVTRNDIKYAVKIFFNFGEREIRELQIYTEFADQDFIPKIVEEADFDKDKVVFETYIEGIGLDELLTDFLNQPDRVKKLIRELVEILTPFWTRDPSIIHRDIKPSNIIISDDGHAHLIDFGIARILGEDSITDTGAPQPGTWRFAAPEQYFAKKELISYRTDFFSLGILAYYLLYGRMPFGNTINEIAANYGARELSYDLPDDCELVEFFQNCFQSTIAKRPRTPEKLLKLLE